MKRSSKAKQQPELIVLSDDDSTVGAPVKKKVVRKERDQPSVRSQEVLELRRKVAELEKKSVPTDEVLELRQKNALLENTLKSRPTDEVLELRRKVAELENTLKSLPTDEVLELRRKVAELENTLKSRPTDEVLELRQKVELENGVKSLLMDEILELRQKNAELENTVKMMKHMKEKRMEILEGQLEKARLDAREKSKIVDEQRKSMDELKRKLSSFEGQQRVHSEAQLKRQEEGVALEGKVNFLSKLLDSERSKTSEDRKGDQQRIDELTRKLAEFDVAKPNLLQLVEKHIPDRIHDPRAINLDPASSDLFLPYKPGMQGTISLRCAKNELLPLYDDDMKAYLQKSDFVDDQRLICALCHATLKGYHILIHFFTKAHAKKVQGSGASVSAASVSYWQAQMEEARPLMVDAMKERIRAAAGADGTAVDDRASH